MAHWTTWPAAPLTRLSMAAAATTRPVRRSAAAATWARLVVATARVAGQPVAGASRSTNGSAGGGVAGGQLLVAGRRGQGGVAGGQDAPGGRHQVRREGDRDRGAAARASSCSISGVAVAAHLVGVDVLVGLHEQVAVGQRPAPDSPDLASTTIPSVATSPAATSGPGPAGPRSGSSRARPPGSPRGAPRGAARAGRRARRRAGPATGAPPRTRRGRHRVAQPEVGREVDDQPSRGQGPRGELGRAGRGAGRRTARRRPWRGPRRPSRRRARRRRPAGRGKGRSGWPAAWSPAAQATSRSGWRASRRSSSPGARGAEHAGVAGEVMRIVMQKTLRICNTPQNLAFLLLRRCCGAAWICKARPGQMRQHAAAARPAAAGFACPPPPS